MGNRIGRLNIEDFNRAEESYKETKGGDIRRRFRCFAANAICIFKCRAWSWKSIKCHPASSRAKRVVP